MNPAVNHYLTERYKISDDQIRPLKGQGSNSANLSPRSDIAPILISAIPDLGNLTLNEVVSHIEDWKDQAILMVNEPSPRDLARIMNPYNELTSKDRDMFKTFRWFVKQGKQNIVMLAGSRNTYTMLDPTTKLFANMCEYPTRKKAMTDRYRLTLTNAYSNKALTGLLVWDLNTSRSGDSDFTYPMYSPDEYYEKSRDYFLGDDSFRIPEPKIISNDPDEAAYLHIDPNHAKGGACPKLDHWVNLRFKESDRDVFRAYVCSIFDPSNESRQALWLNDMGQTGKTTILNAVAQALGETACATLSKSDLKSQFVGSLIYGKRLIVIGDNKNPNIVQSGVVHNALGGDRINVEFKGVTAFSTRVVCRMMIGANCKPEIDASVTHERSRVLILNLIGNDQLTAEQKRDFVYGGGEGALINTLASEVLHFVHKYQDTYTRLAPTHGNLILSDEDSDEMYSTIATEEVVNFDYIVDRYTELTNDPTDTVSRALMNNMIKYLYPSKGASNNFIVSSFKKHLNTFYNIHEVRPKRVGAKRPAPVWSGIKLKVDVLSDVANVMSIPVLGDWLSDQDLD